MSSSGESSDQQETAATDPGAEDGATTPAEGSPPREEDTTSWYVVQPAPSSTMMHPILLCDWSELTTFCQRVCPCTGYEEFPTLERATAFLRTRRENDRVSTASRRRRVVESPPRAFAAPADQATAERAQDAAVAALRGERPTHERDGGRKRELARVPAEEDGVKKRIRRQEPSDGERVGPDPRTAFQSATTANLPRLREYVREYGTADVPAPRRRRPCVLDNGRVVDDDDDEYRGLGSWVQRARTQLRVYDLAPAQSWLSRTQAETLRALGFVHDPPAQVWNERQYGKLVEFRETHGHLNLPSTDGRYAQLRNWLNRVNDAHHARRNGGFSTLAPAHERKLRDLGYAFPTPKKPKSFDERAVEWLAFRAKTGSDQPSTGEHNSGLRAWMRTQRRRYLDFRAGRPTPLTRVQVDKLTAWDFPWDGSDGVPYVPRAGPVKTFDDRIEELKRYREEYGDVLVPQKYPGLGMWVSEQRMAYQRRSRPELSTSKRHGKGPLSDERLARLREVGFVFDLQPNGPRFLKASGREKDLQTRTLTTKAQEQTIQALIEHGENDAINAGESDRA